MDTKEVVIEKANQLFSKVLVGSNVESFGLLNQTLFIDFRNANGDDNRLYVHKGVFMNSLKECDYASMYQYSIMCFCSINLLEVVNIQCLEDMGIEILMSNNEILKIKGGEPEPNSELWQFILIAENNQVSIIGDSNDSISMW